MMEHVNSIMGKGTMMMGSDPSLVVKYTPTGCLPIDDIFQGGIPIGRFTEIYGDYSTLKSYIGLSAIAECQDAGGVAALIDTEGAFDPDWARSIGVNTDELLLPTSDTGEEAIDKTQLLISQGIDLVVWDSIAATLPKAEEKTPMSGKHTTQPARQAAMMSEALRKLQSTINQNNKTAVLCINQTRSKVGIVFGSPESIPGGRSLPFYASYRLAIRKVGKIVEKYDMWDGETMAHCRPEVPGRTPQEQVECAGPRAILRVGHGARLHRRDRLPHRNGPRTRAHQVHSEREGRTYMDGEGDDEDVPRRGSPSWVSGRSPEDPSQDQERRPRWRLPSRQQQGRVTEKQLLKKRGARVHPMSGAGRIKDDGSDDAYLFEIKDAVKSHTLNADDLWALFVRAVRQDREALYLVQFKRHDFVAEIRIIPGGSR
jgi:protein RecA